MAIADFGTLLQDHIERQHRSRCAVSNAAGVDPSTGTRLAQGVRHPSRPMVARYADVLGLAGWDRYEFFAAAGYLAPAPELDGDAYAALAKLDEAAACPDWRRFAQLVAQARALLESALHRDHGEYGLQVDVDA